MIDNFYVENVKFLCFIVLNTQILRQNFYFKSLIKYVQGIREHFQYKYNKAFVPNFSLRWVPCLS